jgi:hypothetical protein
MQFHGALQMFNESLNGNFCLCSIAQKTVLSNNVALVFKFNGFAFN